MHENGGDQSLWQSIVAILSAVLSMVLGWLHIQHRSEVADMKKAIDAAEAKAAEALTAASEAKQSAVQLAFTAGKELSEHKLFAAENFAREADIEKRFDKFEKWIGERFDKLEARLDKQSNP